MENSKKLIRVRKKCGEILIGLWLEESQSCGIDAVTKNKITKIKSTLMQVCCQLAGNDEDIATRYYTSYINYLDQKTAHIIDEMG